MRLTLALATLALLTACAPATLSAEDARAAMTARMERHAATPVKVLEIHALDLSECTKTAGTGTVTCRVRMDVSFDYGGVTERDDDVDQIRFVREAGTWVAYPAD